jgi:hypothetical protein
VSKQVARADASPDRQNLYDEENGTGQSFHNVETFAARFLPQDLDL